MHALAMEMPGNERRSHRRPVRSWAYCKVMRDVMIVAIATVISLTVVIAIMGEQTMWT